MKPASLKCKICSKIFVLKNFNQVTCLSFECVRKLKAISDKKAKATEKRVKKLLSKYKEK